MSRRKNHHRPRMLHQQVLKCFQQQRLFSIHRAAADQHRAGRAGSNRFAQALHNRRRSRHRDVELQISADAHALRDRANISQPRGIFLRLRQK